MGLGLPLPALLPRDAFAAPSNAAKQALNASCASARDSCGLPPGFSAWTCPVGCESGVRYPCGGEKVSGLFFL